MDSSTIFQLTAVIILILLSAFFSSAETAMTTVNKIRVQSLASQGDKRAIILEKIISNSPKMLSTILIGNNIVNMSVSALMTTLTIQLFRKCICRYCYRNPDTANSDLRRDHPKESGHNSCREAGTLLLHGLYIS